ncbi:uncharacterized protein LOC131875950 [Cryptomeria japonica]|uniref:uncharacterized protein LOC131875950 n=1 Tax=Cryptomeria japonica TaxID=3369 RepID=UPI0027D9EB8F|nr:uncharacterized protein LOC131875950 [Cryptomeria japonica]
MSQGDSSRGGPGMDFRLAFGSKPSTLGTKVFDNNLFASDQEMNSSGLSGGPRVTKINGCLERCKERLKLVIPMELLADDIEYYSKHSFYCKFMGLRISLQFLESWAQRTWQPEGEMEIRLLANNYFMVSFDCMADRNRIFEGGPYFYNQVGLFMKPWHAGFNPTEELPSRVPVWVRLPWFPIECWREDVLHLVASLLGKPVGSSQQTQFKKVMTFARVCVEIDLSMPLPDSVEVSAGSYTWVQQIDYETLPFRCRFCHEYGHLQRRCPKAKPVGTHSGQSHRNSPGVDKGKGSIPGDEMAEDGFIPVKARNRNRGQKRTLGERQDDVSFNRFEVLDDLNQQEVNPGLMDLDQGALGLGKNGPPLEVIQVGQESGVGQMDLDQQLIVSAGPDTVHEILTKGGEGSPLPIKTGGEVGKSSNSSSRLGILQKDLKKGVGEKNPKLGRKKDLEKIKSTGETLVESGAVKPLDSHFLCTQK